MKRRPERDSRSTNVARHNKRMEKRLPKPKRKFPRRGITHSSTVKGRQTSRPCGRLDFVG